MPYQAPGMPIAQQPGFAPVPAAPPVRKSRLSIPIILLLFIVSILVGGGITYGILALQGQSNSSAPQQLPLVLSPAAGGSTPTPAATASPSASATTDQLPTPTSFKKGTSSDLGFTMQYPSDWVQDSTQSSTAGNKSIAFHPQAQLPVFLAVGQISATNSVMVKNTTEVNQATITYFGSGNSLLNPQPVANSPKQRMIGSASWDEQDTVFTAGDGTAIHVVSLTVKHSKNYYNILFYAPSSVFDEAMTKYYMTMLNTFQFTV